MVLFTHMFLFTPGSSVLRVESNICTGHSFTGFHRQLGPLIHSQFFNSPGATACWILRCRYIYLHCSGVAISLISEILLATKVRKLLSSFFMYFKTDVQSVQSTESTYGNCISALNILSTRAASTTDVKSIQFKTWNGYLFQRCYSSFAE